MYFELMGVQQKPQSKDSFDGSTLSACLEAPVGSLHQNFLFRVCSTHPATLAVLKIIEAEEV